MYLNILSILKEENDKNPSYFYGSSNLRAKLDTTIDKIRPYAEKLEIHGYVDKENGFNSTFILKIRKKGIHALELGKVDIKKACKQHTENKLKILEILKREHDAGKDIYFVPERIIRKELGIELIECNLLTDELLYYDFINKISLTSPHFTIQITKTGIEYLKLHRQDK